MRMNISEILEGKIKTASADEQNDVLAQMKDKNVFDLSKTERDNLVDFLCETVDTKIAIEYLFHVLDNEISYPIDDDKVKTLFSDDRMNKMKDLMMEELQSESSEEGK